MSQFINIKQGLLRLWLIFTIPWFAWFSWQTYDSYNEKITYQNLVSKTYKTIFLTSREIREGKEYQREINESANKSFDELVYFHNKANNNLNLNIKLLFVPLAFLLFYLLTIWVIHGFKKA
jgi:hypothetical protein